MDVNKIYEAFSAIATELREMWEAAPETVTQEWGEEEAAEDVYEVPEEALGYDPYAEEEDSYWDEDFDGFTS